MPVFALDHRVVFPDPELADSNGLLAVGGDLTPQRLLLAYTMGIFPWYDVGLPILWHSPDPRMVLPVDELHVGRSLRKRLRQRPYALSMDTAFRDVITACATRPRPGQDGTWITGEMSDAYCELHRQGFAHSVEARLDGRLVGGLYGVAIGGIFFGESMYADAPDASKIAFVELIRQLGRWGFALVDCQVHTEHLERFGAREWRRRRFLDALEAALTAPTRRGVWTFDEEATTD